jgi:PAS domain S-box-containing protein
MHPLFANPDALYRRLVEQIEDYAIFALDADGRVRTWNPGAQKFKGYRADEIIGRHFSTFYPPEAVAAAYPQRLLAAAARDGRAEDEGWRVRKDGTRFWANVLITAVRDEDGGLVGFAKITRDLSARRAAEAQSRRLAAEEAAHAATVEKNRELEELTRQLQEQAVELENQNDEAQALAEELEQSNEELQSTLAEMEEAREATAAAEQFTKNILESISNPFVAVDAEWRYRLVNPAAAGLIAPSRRLQPGELIGKVVWELYPDLAGSEFERQMRRAAAERVPVSFEAYYPARGEWSELHCYPMSTGGIAIQWQDITARKRSEEASRYLSQASDILSRSLEYGETLNELARLVVPRLADWCAVEIADEFGKLHQLAVAHVDPAKVRWARELNRKYPTDPNSPTGAPKVFRTGRPELYTEIPEELLVATAVDEEHRRILRELGLKSAIVVPLAVHQTTLGVLTLVSAESGRRYTDADMELAMELAHRAAIAVDNARLHRAAVVAQREAEAANKAKTEFLATMSHELRTPLNAIAGYVELLRMGIQGPVTAGQDEYLGRVQRSQHHLLSLIQDVLNFAKLESGHVEFDITDVPLQPILAEMEGLMLPQIRQAGLTFSLDPCDAAIRARADAERLRQVLLNLLSNAIKFTPAGGSITLGCDTDSSVVRIVVRDTGPGIPAAKREAVFAPFVQLQRDATDGRAGTGLGLSISRDLARAMAGDLRVESELGRGSTFMLTLPRS